MSGNTGAATALRRVEQHMGTVVTLHAVGIAEGVAQCFFDEVRRLEKLLSRFLPTSEISRIARGELATDDADPLVREVLTRCETLRQQTEGHFDHQPRHRTGRASDPILDVNALAKGWIIEQASTALRMSRADEFFINAGGDIIARRPRTTQPWRVGIQHPIERTAIAAVIEIHAGAVATSGTYERGQHIRTTNGRELRSVTVVGPDLADADALSTAVFASGESRPHWWTNVDSSYGLLTIDHNDRMKWTPPHDTDHPYTVLCH